MNEYYEYNGTLLYNSYQKVVRHYILEYNTIIQQGIYKQVCGDQRKS